MTNKEIDKEGKKKRGRHPKYNELTTVVPFRCPISKKMELKNYVNAKLQTWSKA